MAIEQDKPAAPRRIGVFSQHILKFTRRFRRMSWFQPAGLKARDLAKFPEENPNPILRIAQNGTVNYANVAGIDLLASLGSAVGQRLPSVWQQPMLTALSSGSSTEVETAVAPRTFSLFFVPLPDEGYINIYGYDITARKEAETWRDYKALLLAHVHDAVVGTDRNLKVTYWNKAAEEVFGWTEQEALGQETRQIFQTQVPGSSREKALQQLMVTGHYDGEVLYIHRDGSQIVAHARASLLRGNDGEYDGLVTTIHDITARKQAEEALRLSEERFAKAFHSSPVATIITRHEDGRIVDVNEAWSKLLGYTRTEAVGHTPMELKIITMDTRQQVIDLLRSAGQVHNMETTITTDKGEIRHILFSMDLIDIHGEPHNLTTFTDITERERAQKQEMELMLERERIRFLTHFVQDAAHEFRTPLAVINTQAFVMARLLGMEERLSKVAIIEGQVQRITRLVDMLLLLIRLESSGVEEPLPVDVGEIADLVCQKAIQHFGQQPDLHCEVEPGLFVLGNAERLHEAVWQILDNAYRHTPAHGVVKVVGKANGKALHLTVQDSGSGIPATDLLHVFEPFWRQDEARTLAGFGLGLTIAQKIVNQHGGQINLTSAVDVGTTVTVTLPIPNQTALRG
jgi:PAS domain S-box-containing protein